MCDMVPSFIRLAAQQRKFCSISKQYKCIGLLGTKCDFGPLKKAEDISTDQ